MNTIIRRSYGRVLLLFIIMLSSFNTMLAQSTADDVVGVWELEDKTSKMKIYKEGGKYLGKLLYGKDVINKDGTSKKDIKNPDPKLRNQNIIGSTYIKNLGFDGDEYNGGEVYDSSTGKTWSCYAELKNGELHFTGYMGIKWFGQTYVYKRIK